MESEEQDYETPLQDLESQSGEMDDKLERQRRDTEGVQSEWENRQGDTGTPGAQEEGALEDRYGTDDVEPKEAKGDEDDSGDDSEEDEDSEDDDEDSTESRGEGATEDEDEES